MRTSRYFGWVMGLMLWGTTEAALASSGAGSLPSVADAGMPISAETLARCDADFERVVREEWSSSVARKQTRALLSGLSTACVTVLPATLREGAAEAAALRGAERSRRLIEAARSFLPEGCLTPSGTSVIAVESRCPPPEDFLAPSEQGTLDTGSFVFALAVRSQLRAQGAYGERAHRWVDEFILRTMIENEERRKQGAH
jgi:hypothetical protein